MQPWQQPRSQNIVALAEARIVKEAGILALRALQNRQNGEGLQLLFNWCALSWFESMKYLLWFSLELRLLHRKAD